MEDLIRKIEIWCDIYEFHFQFSIHNNHATISKNDIDLVNFVSIDIENILNMVISWIEFVNPNGHPKFI